MNASYRFACFFSTIRGVFSAIFLLPVFFLSTPASFAQSLTLLGSRTFSGGDSAQFVAVKSNYAYVLTGSGSLAAVNVSNPAQPQITGQTQLTNGFPNTGPMGLTLSGNYIYALRKYGIIAVLYVADISNASQPTLAKSVFLTGVNYSDASRYGLAVDGNKLYIAGGRNGVTILDISNPADPVPFAVISNSILGGIVWDVEVANGLAYVGTTGGLNIMDVTDPANAWRVGGVTPPFDAFYLTLRGNYVYIAGERGGNFVQKVDVSNPAAPVQTAILSTPGSGPYPSYLGGIVTTPTLAIVSGDAAGVGLIDITSPNTLTRVGSLPMPSRSNDAAVSGSRVYVADLESGLIIYDLQTPTNPVRLGGLPYSYNAINPKALTALGNLAFIRDAANGILIMDVSNTAQPSLLSTYLPTNGIGTTTAGGNQLYVSTTGGFDIVDISNPAAPTQLGAYRGSTGIPDIAVSGNYVFTTLGEVINVVNPAAPQKVATLPPQFTQYTSANQVKIYGNTLYLVKYDFSPKLFLVDISNPASPNFISSFDIGATPYFDFTVSGGYLYLADGANLAIYNVSIPTNPTYAASKIYNYAGLGGIEAIGAQLFQSRAVSGNSAELDLEDLTNPINPPHAATARLPYVGPAGLAVSGNNVFVLSEQNGTMQFAVYQGALGPAPTQPTLSAFFQTNKVIVRWPSGFPGMKLYSTPALGQAWSLVTSNPYLDGSFYTFTNTHATAPALFYKISSN